MFGFLRSFFLNARTWNIAFRTAHIVAMGVLLGGHVYGVDREQLLPALKWTIVTGIGLAVVETSFRLVWFHQLRGLATLAKIGLMFLVPVFWEWRVWILMAVAVIASAASHAPARFRYYSVLRGEVVRDLCGPGTRRLMEEEMEEDES